VHNKSPGHPMVHLAILTFNFILGNDSLFWKMHCLVIHLEARQPYSHRIGYLIQAFAKHALGGIRTI
jgi:hypothetical protein